MFGRGKKSGTTNTPKSDQVRSHDLFGMPDLSAYAVKDDVEVSHEALEAELAALLDEEEDSDGPKMHRQRRPAPTKIHKADPMKHIEVMAAEAMKDVSDDDMDEDDEEDDALLAELAGITEEAGESAPVLLAPAALSTGSKPSSPDPPPRLEQRPSPAPKLTPSPSGITRSPSPARRPQPHPEPVVPSTAAKTGSEPTDVNALLQQRGLLYHQAIKAAETAGEGSKVRRYKRQLKTIQDMQKKLKQGKAIEKDEIPPEVFVPSPAAVAQPPLQESPSAPAVQATSQPESDQSASTHTKSGDDDRLAVLSVRRDQYKMAAVLAKRSGDLTTAADRLKVAKQFDAVIHAIEAGQEVDLSEMPGPPQTATPKAPVPAPRQGPPVPAPASRQDPPGGGGGVSSEEGYRTPTTVLDALLQRRQKYKSMADKAKEEKNDSKSRRIGRIVKQYEDAIRKNKLGKPVDLAELASLPEFPPFPSQSGARPAPHPTLPAPHPTQPAPQATPSPAAVGADPVNRASQQGSVSPARQAPPAPVRQMSAKENMYQRNIAILKNRINQYKRLALAAKKSGDMYEAKRLLKIAKEIEPMLAAAEGGLPVNLDSIPKLPQKAETEAVSPPASPQPAEGYEMVAGAEAKDVFLRLSATLIKQIEICASNAVMYEKLGNIKSVKRFQEYQEHCQQDLDVVKAKQARGEPIPRHHYEQRTLPTVRVCPDVKENEAEVVIVQGLHLHCPNDKDAKDIDTYIKAEFPYPSDEPQCHKTGWAKGADHPQYNTSFNVDINRSSRAFNSAVKRKALKMEVIYSKGLLRGHKTLGTASLKLADLENKCELHDTVPLLEGRKEIGGKIEVKVRLHHPLAGIKEDFVKEKWLIIDSVRKPVKETSSTAETTKRASSNAAAASTSGSSQRTPATDSIEVLKWEISTLKKKIGELQAHKQQVPKEFVSSYSSLQDRLHKLQTYLKEGGSKARQAYVSRLNALAPNLLAQAKQALQAGHKDRAAMIMTRKKLVNAEMTALTRR